MFPNAILSVFFNSKLKIPCKNGFKTTPPPSPVNAVTVPEILPPIL